MLASRFGRAARFSGALLVVLLSTALFLSAQTSKGFIGGTVTDAQGAAIAGGQVVATNDATAARREVTTNEAGYYRVDALDLGSYTLTISAPGFATATLKNVLVRAGQIAIANASLEVGKVETVVTVTESPLSVQLQTQDGARTAAIESRQIQDIPMPQNTLNPIALAITLPGNSDVSGRDDFSNGFTFTSSGNRPRGNNFLIDSFDNNDISIQGQAFQFNIREAVQEVAILGGANAAEYGRAGVAVTNVITKSGSNAFHGSFWDLHESSALNATDRRTKNLAGGRKAVFTENTFGFTAGGPIMKDKFFFFGSAQWDRFRSTTNGSVRRVPTEAGFAVLRSLPSTPQLQAFLNSFQGLVGRTTITNVALGAGRPAVETGLTQRTSVAQISNSTQFLVKLDILPSSKDTVNLRYIFGDSVLTPDFFNFPGQLPLHDTEQGGRPQDFSFLWTRTISPRFINEFRVSYGRINFSFTGKSTSRATTPGSGPIISLSPFGTFGNIPTGIPQGRLANTYTYQDTVSITRGSHTIRAGFEIVRQLAKQSAPFNSRGSITFSTGGGFTGLANYIDNFSGGSAGVTVASRSFGSQEYRPNLFLQFYFVSDTWRIRPNFSLSLGLRYENFGTPNNVVGFPTLTDDPNAPFPLRVEQQGDNNNWSPRISFAYTPRWGEWLFGKEKTVFRGGYQIGYESFFNNILSNTSTSTPNVLGGVVTNPTTSVGRGLPNAINLVGSVAPVLSRTAGVTSTINTLLAPQIHNWNFGVQRELPWDVLVDVAYVGTRGQRLYTNRQINPGIAGRRLNPTRGSIVIRDNAADSIYHGMQMRVERRFSQGFWIRGAYTWSRFIDNSSEVFVTSGDASRPQNIFNMNGDRGLSVYHRSHRAVFTYLWEIPGPKKGILGQIFGHWSMSGVTTFQTGVPFTVSYGDFGFPDSNRDLEAFNDRPSLLNPNAPFGSWAIDGPLNPSFTGGAALPSGTCLDGPLANNEGIASVQPCSNFRFLMNAITGVNGTVGRNAFTGPGYWNFDWSVIKKFPMPWKEGHNLEFRLETYNLFNHPNLGSGSSIPYQLLDPDFGNFDLSIFGNNTLGRRAMRIQLKYNF